MYRERISQQRRERRASPGRQRKIRAAFAAGGLALGLIVGGVGLSQTHTVTKDNFVPVPDPTVVKITKEVDRGPSDNCKDYLKAVQDMIVGQRLLDESKAELTNITYQIQLNLAQTDGFAVKSLQERFALVENKMNNAWLEIGTAESELDRLNGACEK